MSQTRLSTQTSAPAHSLLLGDGDREPVMGVHSLESKKLRASPSIHMCSRHRSVNSFLVNDK